MFDFCLRPAFICLIDAVLGFAECSGISILPDHTSAFANLLGTDHVPLLINCGAGFAILAMNGKAGLALLGHHCLVAGLLQQFCLASCVELEFGVGDLH